MSFLCTTINRKVSHHQCVNECQYFFKSACIDKMNEAYNQALEDIKKYILNSCNNVNCREDINADNDFDFYASELLDMLEEMKK